jgi:hypothetical protein
VLVVLNGVSDFAIDSYAYELARRADFERVKSKDFDPETLFTSEIASYKPGTGQHLVTFHHHWRELIQDESIDLTLDFKIMEMFLASRGAVTVLVDPNANPDIDGSPELLDHIHRQTMTSMHELPPDDLIALARNQEAEVEPLTRWRHYIGIFSPTNLVICQPSREKRKEYLDRLRDNWMEYGFASSGATPEELDLLWQTLDGPKLIGFGRLAPQIENWVASRGGSFLN